MLLEEAQWLGRHLRSLNAKDISPLCNIGSASEEYRRVVQPYIDTEIFAPAQQRGIAVLHVDAKQEAGVDLVGDLTDPTFLVELARRKFNAAMCCNLLEHVTDRPIICDAIMSMLPPGGYVIVTVPNRFPYHEDPIDTMFRPNVTELAALFPGASIVSASIVRASRFRYDMDGSWDALFWLLVRCLAPFYRPQRWVVAMRCVGELIAGYKVTCAILRKTAIGARQPLFESNP
jgi:hypothetical protein